MTSATQAYFLVLLSTLCFSTASLFFTDLSRRLSPLWMNAFKALIAWLCFGVVVLLGGTWTTFAPEITLVLLLSGVLGLAIGDIFLLTAYARMGSARTLILYGFQPLFLGVAAHFLFHQDLGWIQAIAVLFFVACLFLFSLERFRESGKWEVYGLAAALFGVLLDNSGVLLTRWAFDHAPEMSAFEANFIRCTGALAFFLFIGRVREVHLRHGWAVLTRKERGLALLASFLGTFMSLYLYLSAVKIGHLASLAALSAAAPIVSSALECLVQRRRPSRYLVFALFLFLLGFSLLLS